MGPFDIAAMGVLTGLIFVVGSLVVILVIVLAQLRLRRARTEMLHQERMLAIEKGVPLPLDLLEPVKRRRPYVRGLVFGGVGLGIIIMGSLDSDTDLVGIGTIFLLVGIALVVGDYITARKAEPRSELLPPPLPEVDPYRSPENRP